MPNAFTTVPWEGIVETSQGPAFVNVIGDGPPVFIVHGGPGFDHGYLFKRLSFLAEKRTLIFYDQPGCGKSPAEPGEISLSKTARHFCAVVEQLAPEGEYGLIAHSWGSLVAIAAFAEKAAIRPNAFTQGLLINPVPLRSGDYEKCAMNLLSRIPAETFKRAQGIMQAGESGETVMELLLPYYVPHPESLSGLSMPFRYDTYLGINAQLGDFDFREQLSAFSNLTLVRGAEDFTTSELLVEMLDEVLETHILNSVGHFPFIEDEQAFSSLAMDVFS